MDIRTKLILTLIGAALLSMTLFGYLTYLMSAELFLQNSGRQLASVAASQARGVEVVLDHWRAQVAALAVRDDVASPGGLQRLLATVATDDIRWLSLYDSGGRRLATTASNLAPRAVAGSPGVARARVLADGTMAVVLVAPLAGSIPGTLEAGFRIDVIDAITADIVGETGLSRLLAPSWIATSGVENGGYAVVSTAVPGPAVFGSLAEAPDIVAGVLGEPGQEGRSHDGDYLGTAVMASSQVVGDSQWRVLVTIERMEELAWVDALRAQLTELALSLGAAVILGGVGVGLYLARRIRRLADTVDRIRHGEVELRAEVEGEDEVTLLARSLNEFMDQLHHSADIFQMGSLRILVAESLARNRALLLELLTNWRMQPTLVSDGASALAAIEGAQRDGEPIQLIVVDQTLPDMPGIEVAARLKAQENWEHCPIIMMVSDPDALELQEAKRLGIGHVLPKPVIASDLMEAALAEMGVSAPAMTSMPDMLLAKTTPRKILLVDDSTIIQRVTTGFLERWGHNVTVVDTGRSAVEATSQEGFDLVFMDLEMPEMNGIDATRVIREDELTRGARIPIIALTAKATKEDREACMEAGMDDYLCKPVDPKLLYAVVNAHPATALSEASVTRTTDLAREAPMSNETTDGGESPIDWQVALSLTAGDVQLLKELIELFPAEAAKHLAAVRQAIADRDAEQLTRAAHTLKSSAGFFGAPTLVACALRVEQLGKESEIDGARECLAALEAETLRLTAALERERPPDGEKP